MKLHFAYILFFVLSIQMQAQYSITPAGNPVIGETEKAWPLDTLGLFAGTSGTNQIWNFSGISINPLLAIKSNSFTATEIAPNSTLFPLANIAQTSDGSGYTMFNYSNSSIIIYGYTNSTLNIVYQNPMKLADLPFSFGTTCVDTWSTSYTYSATPVTETGTITTSSDAFGTLVAPGNSYPNVLRVKIENYKIQSAGAITNTETTVDYKFFSSISKHSLLTVTNKTLSSSTSTVISISKSGSVAHMVLQGVNQNTSKSIYSMFPNPVNDKEINLLIDDKSSEKYLLTIYDCSGKKIKSIVLNSEYSENSGHKINLKELDSGIYFMSLTGNKKSASQKLIIN